MKKLNTCKFHRFGECLYTRNQCNPDKCKNYLKQSDKLCKDCIFFRKFGLNYICEHGSRVYTNYLVNATDIACDNFQE